MVKPDFQNGVVTVAKVLDYLLCETHPDGRSKARFFRQFGFDRREWQVLERALIHHAVANLVMVEFRSEFGVKYTLDGPLQTPAGVRPNIRCIWIVESKTAAPRLVTAYPL